MHVSQIVDQDKLRYQYQEPRLDAKGSLNHH
ncbi:MAG: hypothetical protein ACC657_03270 [Thiohalomonadales bacterium]